jgi:glutamate-5-semialdehyde dehydrogenase
MNVKDIAQRAKVAASELLGLTEEKRTEALGAIAEQLRERTQDILNANARDLEAARAAGLSGAIVDRLSLNQKSILGLSQMCLDVAAQPQVVGQIAEEYLRPNGLIIQKQRIPIGVIGMIFESRPNVVVDGAALAIKSGNAIILKGGKEAQFSNRILSEVIQKAISGILPAGSVALIETREDVAELLKLGQYIDLMVPRGGSSLIEHVKKHATMPVVAHDKGLCHIYVHADAEEKRVIPIVLNAKVQRPGVCNALESLLLHESYAGNREVIARLIDAGVEVRGCENTQRLHPAVHKASPGDYHTEWLEKKVSVRIVGSEDEAIAHIREHSSHHTEAILARDQRVILKFMNSLDASAIMVNASTRFNDGGELGLGAELGISTSKLHAYGPMGAKEMTTTRFLVKGEGHIRE